MTALDDAVRQHLAYPAAGDGPEGYLADEMEAAAAATEVGAEEAHAQELEDLAWWAEAAVVVAVLLYLAAIGAQFI